MQIYLQNWYKKLLDQLPTTKTLRIISPFISEQVIRNIKNHFNFNNFELITRFNLCDFAMNVSSLEGLKFALEKGAKVYGVKNLHSKVYIFDDNAAVITSANLTNGGLISNYECGLYTNDLDTIEQLVDYFNQLKTIGTVLSNELCEKWLGDISSKEETHNSKKTSFPDYGGTKTQITNSKNYYIKFFGTANHRAPLTFTVKDEIDQALCHYACGFPENKKPRQINEGDIIYLARLTHDPHDCAIFGKAEAVKYVDARDRATKEEIVEREWKKKWPIYLRLTNPIFIDGQMGDCIFLYDLINVLDYESFPSTQERYNKGERDINPRKSLSQQPYIKLTLRADLAPEICANGFVV